MILTYDTLANNNYLQNSIKLVEPKSFNGNTMQGHAWLSILKCYFIVLGLTFTAAEAADTEAVCQYAVVLMASNTARWIDKLEVQGHVLNSFLEFEKLFINQYAPLNNKNVARDKLCELQQCSSV